MLASAITEFLDLLLGGFHQARAWHDSVYQASSQSGGGAECTAFQNQVESFGDSNQSRQSLGATEARHDPEFDFRQSDAGGRVIAGDTHVEAKSHFESATEAGPFDCADYGKFQVLEHSEDCLSSVSGLFACVNVSDRFDNADVGTGCEHARNGTGHNQPTNLITALQALECFLQGVEAAFGQGDDAFAFRPETQDGDAI
jgi:hypothetical protein